MPSFLHNNRIINISKLLPNYRHWWQFFDVPVEQWPEGQSYKIACEIVNNLASVNDCAERAVTDTRFQLNHNEEQKQYPL